MQNPWHDLPKSAPFVLESDAPAIQRFNERATDHHRVQFGIPPEPFIGRPDASVLFLALNPGFATHDLKNYSEPTRETQMLSNLRHESTGVPFYFLDPAFAGTGGDSWWSRKLRRLIEATSRDLVANNAAVVEFFGYKSRRYKWLGELVPSQEYSFHLVRQAMRRDAVIVLMRSAKTWLGVVPELESYPHLHRLKNPQNVSVSPGNMEDGWDKVVGAVASGR